MIYELAKKLKEAGFPQKEAEQYTTDGQWIPEEERIYILTLSELIKACGNGFQNLNRFDLEWMTNFMEDENAEGDSIGNTPEEAVANLWLKLNK